MSELKPSPRANLQYVCDMLEQLKTISGSRGGSLLIYLLDMARLEAAEEVLKHPAPSRQKRDAAI